MLKENQDNQMETEDHISQIVHKTLKIELHEQTIEERNKTIGELNEMKYSSERNIKGLTE